MQKLYGGCQALYVTQPTVTHAIQMLEKELDCILFQRSRKAYP
ncbi:helix-turn-helix domain-containing protein [Eisenbergiella tayi]